MGGGAGASIHGRFRIATENSVYTMSLLISRFKQLDFLNASATQSNIDYL